jgi:hypothetical protein
MVITKNAFIINILPKILVIKTVNNIFAVNIIKKRRKIKIKFKKKKKKINMFITSNPLIQNFFINYNKTIQYNTRLFVYKFKSSLYLLRNKLKWNFIKFKYRGKGFKVKKFNKLSKITFRLGKSH